MLGQTESPDKLGASRLQSNRKPDTRRVSGGMSTEAVAIFGLNLKAYPESANGHDSLADGLRAQGRLEEAEAKLAG